jgi:hypothetical protein
MLEKLNNIWIIGISFILLIIIIRKIYYLNKPFDKKKFIQQYLNQKKLKKNIDFSILTNNIASIASYYIGIV